MNVEFTFSKGVPKLDGSVSRSRNNLSVISGEGNGENISGVSNESSSGESSVKIPCRITLLATEAKSRLILHELSREISKSKKKKTKAYKV